MSKRGGNHPVPGHFKVQGGAIEDRETARTSKQALVRQAARLKRRPGAKGNSSVAPPAQRAAEAATLPSATVLERVHDREFAKMNERKPANRVKPSRREEQPRYFTDAARGLLRRLARYAMAPLSLARAVVERIRVRESHES